MPRARETIAHTPQENMLLAARGARHAQQLDQARLDWIFGLFPALHKFWLYPAGKLSGGMKQKLALSCTLVHTPRILLLDEPTTGVDPLSRSEFWEILRELREEGVTILVTTPYMDEASECDRVAFMHRGRRLKTGTPESIVTDFSRTVLEIVCDAFMEAAALLRESGLFHSVQQFGDRIHVISGGYPSYFPPHRAG